MAVMKPKDRGQWLEHFKKKIEKSDVNIILAIRTVLTIVELWRVGIKSFLTNNCHITTIMSNLIICLFKVGSCNFYANLSLTSQFWQHSWLESFRELSNFENICFKILVRLGICLYNFFLFQQANPECFWELKIWGFARITQRYNVAW